MKLLIDENLSRRLLAILAEDFPESTHPDLVDMRGTSDDEIWEYAKIRDYILVSKDNDFRQKSFLYGAPPKVIWLMVGNAGTDLIARLLKQQRERITLFASNPEESLLVLQFSESMA